MRGLAAVGAIVFMAGARVAAAQSIDQRLAKVSADVFSSAAHADADIAELKAILAEDPKSATAHVLLGVAYLTKGSPDLVGEAAGELRQAIDLDPSLIPARLYLARLYLDLGRPERASEELQAALAAMPGQPQLQALLAESQRQLGKPDAALDLTAQALKSNPSLAEARYYQGLALYDLKRRDEAIKAFEEVLQAGGKRPEVYASLGNAYLEAGRLDEAIKSLTDGITLDPTRPGPVIQLARAYRLKGQLTKAETWLTRARSIAPPTAVSAGDQQVQRDLSFEEGLIRLKQSQLAAAARSFKTTVDLDPNYGPGYRYLAEVYLRQGLYARALDQATRAEKLGCAAARRSAEDAAGESRGRPPQGTGVIAPARLLPLSWFVGIALAAGQKPPASPAPAARFTDVTAAAKIGFVQKSGASPDKRMVETFGSGVAWIDYDNDGFPDLFFVNGAPGSSNALYHNNRDGTFTDVTAKAGVAGSAAGDRVFKTGVAVGDYDNDGYLDLFVTALGPDTLYRNNHDGTFTDVTAQAGVAGAATAWSTSAGFFDYDHDGRLDLFVAHYVDYRLDEQSLLRPEEGRLSDVLRSEDLRRHRGSPVSQQRRRHVHRRVAARRHRQSRR